jgi:hypothetical protein
MTMNRQQLLDRIDNAWTAFQQSYAGLPDAQLIIPGVTGDWSVKDLLAHITIWEEEALKFLPLIMDGGRPPRYSVTYGGIDAFNAQMIERWRSVSLADVQHRHHATHARLIDLVQTTPEDQFIRETPFRRRLRLDTYSHYPIHTEAITEWRARQLDGTRPSS